MLSGILFTSGLVLAGSDGAWFPLPNILGLCLMLWLGIKESMAHLADDPRPIEWQMDEKAIKAIKATGGTYNDKEKLAKMGFHWNYKSKAWELPLKEKEL